MKVRIGISLGPATGPDSFAAAIAELEAAGIDSLWLSEMVYGSLLEPFTGMTYALARTTSLKVGTGVAVLPGRHPVLVAKQLASLAALAPRRVLPVFGLQPARPAERVLFPAPRGRRGAMFDEAMVLLRRMLTEDQVTFAGEFYSVEQASVGPRPERPLDIWLGGTAPAALQRVGRLADGWLGSFRTPAEAAADRVTIQAAASAAGREIEDDHYGISLAVGTGGIPAGLAAAIAARRPDADPAALAAGSWAQARAMIEAYVAGGLSKFVVRPADPEVPLTQFLDDFRRELLPLQN
jgi:probable F420-dependent oxidoreductase